jgi:peptidoglycan/LPS O-acetylase OafA/YrhL
MSLIGPSIGRTIWCSLIAFMILASCSHQHDEGRIARFFQHKVFYFFHRTSFTCYILNPLVVMILLFSCEFPIHFDIASLIPFVNGLYCLTIIASVAFSVLIEFPLSRIVDFTLRKLTSTPLDKSRNKTDSNGNVKDVHLTSVKTNVI